MKDYDYEEDVKNPSRWKMLKVLALMMSLLTAFASVFAAAIWVSNAMIDYLLCNAMPNYAWPTAIAMTFTVSLTISMILFRHIKNATVR